MAEICSNDRFVLGSNLACFERSVNELISFGVPDCALTVAFSVILLASIDSPVVAFAYDSSPFFCDGLRALGCNLVRRAVT